MIQNKIDQEVRQSIAAVACPTVPGASTEKPSTPHAPVQTPLPRWTLKRLITWIQEQFGRQFCRETIRKILKRLGFSWKKAKKLLGRADPEKRLKFLDKLKTLLNSAMKDEFLLVYLDEAHIHQDVDLGYGWSLFGERFWVSSNSPGLSAKVSFYGLYLYNEGQVRIWPYDCGNGENTVKVLRRLRQEFPDRKIKLIWDGASYHRSLFVRQTARDLKIDFGYVELHII